MNCTEKLLEPKILFNYTPSHHSIQVLKVLGAREISKSNLEFRYQTIDALTHLAHFDRKICLIQVWPILAVVVVILGETPIGVNPERTYRPSAK